MYCPFCRHSDSKVVDSRTTEDGTAIRRRRKCTECGRRFSTLETTSIAVIKRSGVTEPFDRQKIVSGVRKACQGRPVSEDDLAMLAQEVEESVRASGSAEIDAHDVGLAILTPLRRLDGTVRGFACPVTETTDVDAWKRSEAALRDAQMRLEGALGAAQVATWTWNVRENRLYADANLARLFGVAAADIDGGPVEAYLTLSGSGREVELGAFLTPDERRALDIDLRSRLAALRQAPEPPRD